MQGQRGGSLGDRLAAWRGLKRRPPAARSARQWEVFTGAGEPFADVPRAHLGHAITKEGRRPRFPPFAPAGYVALAQRCW